MSTAPQLQLSIQPSTTSFKRSFEQFGVDLGSPVGVSNPDAPTTNACNGNDRNKRARNSITSISEESTVSSSSLADLNSVTSQSSSSSSSSPNSMPNNATTQVLGLTDHSTPVISLRPSAIPPRLPTPDIQDVDMSDFPHQESDLEAGNTSNTAILLPLDLPAQHAAHPSSSTASSLAAPRTQSDTQNQLRLSLERFNAFDSEIAVLRLPIDPILSARTRVHRPPTPPPTLPPITLSAEQGVLAPFFGDSTADPSAESSQSSMDRRVRYQPDRHVYRPLQLHQSREDDNEEETEDEQDDDDASDSDEPPRRIQSRIHDAFREHLDSALDRLRSGSPFVPDLEGEQEEEEDEEEVRSAIPLNPPILPPIVMEGLETLLDDSESQQPPAESTSQARSDSRSITPRVASTSNSIAQTISNPSLGDHRLPSPLLRELHNWMDEDDIEEGPAMSTEFLVGPFSRHSNLQPWSTYVGLPQLDVGGGLGLGLEENETSHRVQGNSHAQSRASREVLSSTSSRSPTVHRQDRSRLHSSSRPPVIDQITFGPESNTHPSTSSFRNRTRRFQNSASLVSEALAEARARREMEDIRANRHDTAFREPTLLTRERSESGSAWRSRRLSLHREPESPLFSPSEEFYFDEDDYASSTGRRSQDWHRRMEREERVEQQRARERDSERGMGGWIALGIGLFGDSREMRSGHDNRSESRQRVGESSTSRSASTSRSNAPPTAARREHDGNRGDEGSAQRDTVSISADFRTELSMLRETMAGLTRTLETAVGASASHSSNMTESTSTSQPTRRHVGGLPHEDPIESESFYSRRGRHRSALSARRTNASPPRRPLSPDDGDGLYGVFDMLDDSAAGLGEPSRNVRSRSSRSAQLGFGTNFVESAAEGEGGDEGHASEDRQSSPGPGGRSARGIVISDLDSHNAILDGRLDMNIALGVGAAPAAPPTRPSQLASMTSRPHRFSWMGGRRRDRSLTDLLSGILPSSPTSPSSGISHSPLTSSSTSLHLPASSFLDEPLHRHRPLAEEDESDMDVDYEMGIDTMDTTASFDRPSLPAISQPSIHERVSFNGSFIHPDTGFGLRSPPSPIEFRRHSSHSFPGEVAEANSHSTFDASSDDIGSTDVSHSHHTHTHNHNHSQQQHIASTSPPQPPSLPPPDLGRPLSPTHIPSSTDNSYRMVDDPERVDASRNGVPSAIHTASNPYSRVPMDSSFAYQNLATPPLPPTPNLIGSFQEYGVPYFVSGPHPPPVSHSATEIYDGRESDGGNPDVPRYRARMIPVPRHPQYMSDPPGPPNPARMTDSPFLRSERLPSRPSGGSSWHRSQNARPTLPSVFGNSPVDASTFAPGPFRNTFEHMMTERGGYRPHAQQGGRPHYQPPAPTIPPIVFDNNAYDMQSRSRADDTRPPSSTGHTMSASMAEPVDRLGNLRRSINEFEHRIFHRPPLSSTSTASSFASARGAAFLNQEANNSASNLHNYVHHHYHHHPHSNASPAVNQQQTINSWSGDSSTIRPSPSSPRRYPRPYTSSASDMHRLLTERVRMDGSRLENTSHPPHLTRLPHPAELSGTLRNPASPSEVIPMRPEPGPDASRSQQLADRYRRMHDLPTGASYRDRMREQMGGSHGANGSQRTGEENRETVTPRSASRWLSGSGSDDSNSISNPGDHMGDFMTAMRGRRARFTRPESMSLFGRRRSRQALGDYMHDDEFDASYENLLNLAATLGDVRAKSTPEEIINTQETAMYKQWATAESDQRCPICLDDYAQDDMVLKLSNCSHWLHRDCLKQWLQTANTCPVCRKRVDVPPSNSLTSTRPRTRGRLSYGNSIHRGFSALRRASDPMQTSAQAPSTSTSGVTGANHVPLLSSTIGVPQPSNITIAMPRSQERSSSPTGPARLLLRRDSTGFSAFHRFFDSP